MERILKTRVDEKHFGKRLTMDKVISDGEQYIYQVINNDTPYFIKGHKILLEYLKPGNGFNKTMIAQALNIVGKMYYEYCFHKIMANFSPHFLEALEIDLELEVPADGSDLSYLYIEILFEYGGESLGFSSVNDVNVLYSLMKQSANALSLLGNIGISSININPINMFYNGNNDLLKLMDMGDSFEYETRIISLKKTPIVRKSIRQFTAEFAPPEILQEKIQLDAIKGMNIDVYCWAMCFYTLFLKKTQAELKYEADYYKLNTEEQYEGFIKNAKIEITTAMEEAKTLSENKLREFIITKLFKALEYTPTKRPKISEIVLSMEELERIVKIRIPYLKKEAEFEEQLARLLNIDKSRLNDNNENIKNSKALLESLRDKKNDILAGKTHPRETLANSPIVQDTTQEIQKEVGPEKMRDECKSCLEGCNKKVKLKCGHILCKDCINAYILSKFSLDEKYQYKAFCVKCNKIKELCNSYYNNIANIYLKCRCEWNAIGTKLKTKIKFDRKFSF